ncbi:MAG: LysR family transcriptional regulator, partial [Betaproteobacteria bacterium]|nr:LysR family transcriptional regulator [Betaproteobacteria bacterium]
MPRAPRANRLSAPAAELAPPAGAALNDWNLLRTFVAVYEVGTLTQAARLLGATQPSLGRHVRELERVLGEALFVRRPGRL